MEKNVDLIKKTFQKELMGLSPKVNELAEVIWFVFKMGGSAPTAVISSRFQNFNEDLGNLKELGILRTINDVTIFAEGFENRLLRKNINEITIEDVHTTMLESYSAKLAEKYSLDELIDPISTVLSVIINSTTPDQPVFLSKLLRSIKDALKVEDLGKSKEVLEYYLMKYLGLVELAGSYGVNLSEKAREIVQANSELFEAYKTKPRGEKSIPAQKAEQRPQEPSKAEAPKQTRPEEDAKTKT